MSCDVAVIGGGLGGLALTAGLKRRGYNVKLFESAPVLRTGTATLIGLGGNAFNSLDEVHPNIVPELKRRGIKCSVITSVLRESKQATIQERKTPSFADLYTIRWSEVQHSVAEQVPSDAVQCGYRAVGYTEEPGQEVVHVHFKGQPDVTAKLVVAADGVRSALRATMLPQDPGPRYLGHMNWNALLHNVGNHAVNVHEPGEISFWSDSHDFDKTHIHAQIMDAGHGYTYLAVRVQADQPSYTCPEGGGLGRPGSKARVAQMLDDAGFDLPLKLLQAIPEEDLFERAMVDRLPLDELCGRMSSEGGRVVLLGDAAHAMHPQPGMGGRTAFEDAHALLMALEQQRVQASSMAALFGAHALAAAVAQYERMRLTRTSRLQRYAAESAGLADIRIKAGFPLDMAYPERMQRFAEFNKWVSQYPENPDGDPQTKYWQPVVRTKVQANA